MPNRASSRHTAPGFLELARVLQSAANGKRVIGGVFGLEAIVLGQENNLDWPFLRPETLHLASARGALCLLADLVRPQTVWLPSYLCPALVDALSAANVAWKFFPVSKHLCCESAEWLRQIVPNDIVLRIHYFGFPNTDPVLLEAAARGALLVDDAAQALLTAGMGTGASAIIYSPRKFLGVPDGGCLVTLTPGLRSDTDLPAVPAAWWSDALSAVALRREFDSGNSTREWFPRFQEAEQAVPSRPCAMSHLTRGLLRRGVDYGAISTRRRLNYQALLEMLAEFALLPTLAPGAVPLGFPVRCPSRDAIRTRLFDEQIFPPVHWHLKACVPDAFADSHRLSAELMTLPCDQRYDEEDMKRVAKAFKAAYESAVGLKHTKG